MFMFSVCFCLISLRPWDHMNDVIQYEHEFVIQTKTRHQTPIVHTTSITNVAEKAARSRHCSQHSVLDCARVARLKRASLKHHQLRASAQPAHAGDTVEDRSSSPEGGLRPCDTESSISTGTFGFYVEICLHDAVAAVKR